MSSTKDIWLKSYTLVWTRIIRGACLPKICVFLLACVFMTQAQYTHPQNEALVLPESGFLHARPWDEHTPRSFEETLRHGVIAMMYCLLSNTIVMYFNGTVTGADWAFPTVDTISHNLTGQWKWEDADGFLVNQLGHPFQGSIYFGAGRANGFGFYSSLFFSAFGSLTWEIFHEGMVSSTNDMLTTIPAALSMGEILYRLYLQAHSAGVPAVLTFLFNPAVGLHRLVTGWEPPPVDNNFYELRFYVGGGFSDIDYSVRGPMVYGRENVFSHAGPVADAGFRIIYGDPFIQNTSVPFRHFEFSVFLGTDVGNHKDVRVFSDGYLLSFSPIHTETSALSTGLSLHMDLVFLGESSIRDSTINMYSNALNWTVKYRRLFSPNITWRTRAHAGFTFFGVSKYYCPVGVPLEFHPENIRHDLNNFGYGLNFKHSSSFEFGRRNRLDVSNFFYFQWSYPGTSALSEGFVRWQFHDVAFSRLVSERVTLGGAFSLATERGSFGEFPSTRKNHWSVRTFVAWNGNNIRAPLGGRI